jgi:hypothetical protein
MELVPDSRRSAKLLLAAWNSGDCRRMRTAIDQAHALEPTSPGEAERMEMIHGAGRAIGQWMEAGKLSADLDASLEVLRHLAGSGPAVGLSVVPRLERRASSLR